jgi:hypothetical protein
MPLPEERLGMISLYIFEDAGEMRDLSTPALAVGAWSDQGFVEIAREQRQPV